MIERDIAHLKFLQGRTSKGDVLTQEDYDFVMNFENQIQMYQNMVCNILASERQKCENL